MSLDNTVLKYSLASRKYETFVPNAKEIIRQPLYDTQTYLAAGQTELSFFQTPKGSGGKTFADTNMELAGQLPAGKSFLVEAIGIQLFPTATPNGITATPNFLNDVYTFAKGGHLQFFISSKPYIEVSPLESFPPKTGIISNPAVVSTTAATSITSNYAQLGGEPYTLDPAPLMIVPNTNFSLTMKWPTALPLPSTQDMRVVCTLYGMLYRWVQ